jgi:ADP-ribose pyrophosphatase
MLDREGFRPNVGIILLNAQNEVWWGKRVREHSWQFPQGGIKYGETPEQAMYRELEEETGYTGGEWQFVTKIHNAIAYSDEYLDLYLARGLKAGKARLDEGEFLETFTATIDELLQWVREGKITDVKTIIGVFWLDKLRAGDWKL